MQVVIIRRRGELGENPGAIDRPLVKSAWSVQSQACNLPQLFPLCPGWSGSNDIIHKVEYMNGA